MCVCVRVQGRAGRGSVAKPSGPGCAAARGHSAGCFRPRRGSRQKPAAYAAGIVTRAARARSLVRAAVPPARAGGRRCRTPAAYREPRGTRKGPGRGLSPDSESSGRPGKGEGVAESGQRPAGAPARSTGAAAAEGPGRPSGDSELAARCRSGSARALPVRVVAAAQESGEPASGPCPGPVVGGPGRSRGLRACCGAAAGAAPGGEGPGPGRRADAPRGGKHRSRDGPNDGVTVVKGMVRRLLEAVSESRAPRRLGLILVRGAGVRAWGRAGEWACVSVGVVCVRMRACACSCVRARARACVRARARARARAWV